MTPEPTQESAGRGYGNIYTPHAGSMIIHVQRESGLANRTIVLTQRQVRLFRRGAYAAAIVLALILTSWLFLATQAARVPLLTRRVKSLQHDVSRLDTLQSALTSLEARFAQVQQMLGATAPSSTATADTSAAIPSEWPLPTTGTILSADSGTAPVGIDIAVPPGTEVRSAGAGSVVEVSVDASGTTRIRIAHRDGYETVYDNASDARVTRGQHVGAGTVLARTGGATPSSPPHLHFQVLHNGANVDPLSLMKQGPPNGDLQ